MATAMMLRKTQPPTVPPTIAPIFDFEEPELEEEVGELAGGAVTVTVLGPSAEVGDSKNRCTVSVAFDSAQPCCVMVVFGYTTRNCVHSPSPDSVHFAMAELLEHAKSVQAVDKAVLGIHVVGSTQPDRFVGLQQPWTPK